MSEESFDQVQQLFLEALELPDDQRGAWLIEQCGDDRELLNEIRSLLGHDSPADDPLENPLDEVISDVEYVARLGLGEGTLRHVNPTSFHVRCPHCHSPIEFLEEAPSNDIECPSCGSSFSLLGDDQQFSGRKDPPEIANFKLVEPVGTGWNRCVR